MRLLDTATHVIEVPDRATISNARIISVDEFVERFPDSVWDQIATSTLPRAVAFVKRLQSVNQVNLDSRYIVDIVNDMRGAGLINQAQANAIRA